MYTFYFGVWNRMYRGMSWITVFSFTNDVGHQMWAGEQASEQDGLGRYQNGRRFKLANWGLRTDALATVMIKYSRTWEDYASVLPKSTTSLLVHVISLRKQFGMASWSTWIARYSILLFLIFPEELPSSNDYQHLSTLSETSTVIIDHHPFTTSISNDLTPSGRQTNVVLDPPVGGNIIHG